MGAGSKQSKAVRLAPERRPAEDVARNKGGGKCQNGNVVEWAATAVSWGFYWGCLAALTATDRTYFGEMSDRMFLHSQRVLFRSRYSCRSTCVGISGAVRKLSPKGLHGEEHSGGRARLKRYRFLANAVRHTIPCGVSYLG